MLIWEIYDKEELDWFWFRKTLRYTSNWSDFGREYIILGVTWSEISQISDSKLDAGKAGPVYINPRWCRISEPSTVCYLLVGGFNPFE